MANLPSDYDITPTNNTLISGINAAEGMPAANTNNLIRDLAATIAKGWGGMHEGTTRPVAVQADHFWRDITSATAPIVKLYDGVDDITVMTFNYTANTVTFPGAGILSLIEDTTPQLGGNLDLNGFTITGLSVGTADLANNAVTLAKMAQMATASFLGRTTAATGDPEVLSDTQATAILNAFTSSLKGLVPSSGGGTVNFLRADGTFAAPSSGLTLETPINTTSGTTHDFTGLPAGTDRLALSLNGVSLSGNDLLDVLLGDSGGFETAGYESTAYDGNSTDTTTAFRLMRSSAAAQARTGVMFLQKLTGNEWLASGQVRTAGAAPSRFVGSKTLSGELTQIRLNTNGANTFDAGKIGLAHQK